MATTIGYQIVGASPDEKVDPNRRTCRLCGVVGVPRKAGNTDFCIHCGSVYDKTGSNAARYPKQGTDVTVITGSTGFTIVEHK
jgi:hypothetical protein